jgi:hypothetical protein
MSCFKIRAKTLQISLGHIFHPIELKLGVLPILVVQIKEKYKKNQKVKKLDFY